MSFRLKGNFVFFVKFDNTGIVHKGRKHPRSIDVVGGLFDIGFNYAVYAKTGIGFFLLLC